MKRVALALTLMVLIAQPAEAGRLKMFARKAAATGKCVLTMPFSMAKGALIFGGAHVFSLFWRFAEIESEESE